MTIYGTIFAVAMVTITPYTILNKVMKKENEEYRITKINFKKAQE